MAYLVYDINADGKVTLPPIEVGESSPSAPPRSGYDRRECTSIHDVERIERILQQQSRDEREHEAEADASTFLELKRDIRRRIMAQIESSSTSPLIRDMLLAWCQLRDEARREHWKSIIMAQENFIEGLHNDRPRTIEEVGIGESQ